MTGAADGVFLDTNVLVYANVASSPLHQRSLEAMQSYVGTGTTLWISRQVLREYLAAVTLPQVFSTPVTPREALTRVRYFQSHFRIAEDGPEVTERLLALVEQIPIGGKQIHDANIVATMQAHALSHLPTHNTADFARFTHLITVVPL